MKINQAFTILQRAGGIRAARIITENTKKLSRIRVLLMAYKLRRGMPVAKIIHQKWFFGLKFYTNRYTLDPRPDTETLVECIISDYKNKKDVHILDIGTGTGCIICAIVNNMQNAHGTAIDISRNALRVAKKNIKQLGLTDKIHTKRMSFCSGRSFDKKFDVIVSNPPYIAHNDDRVNNGAKYDPKRALYANKNGLAAYMEIAKNARQWIKNNGYIYVEIGAGQGNDVQEIFTSNCWEFVRSEKDLGGIDRVLIFKMK